VQPLEEFLNKPKSSPAHPLPDELDPRRRGMALPAAGAPPPGREPTGAIGVIVKPGESTAPAAAHPFGQQHPAAGGPQWGAPQGYPQQGGYPPPNHGGYPGMQGQMPGAPQGMPGMQPYPQQQMQGMPGVQQPFQSGMPGMQPGMHPGMQPGMHPGMQPGMQYPQGGSPYPSGMAGAPPQAKQGPLDELVTAWTSASLPRKITYLLAPFAIIGFFVIFFTSGSKPHARKSKSGKATSSASAGPSGSAPVAKTTTPTPTPPKDSASAGPAPPETAPTAPTTAKPEQPAPTPPTAPAQEAAADAGVPKLKAGELTKQRQAVDAVAAGDDAKAIQLYEELAKEDPGNPAYKTALEMLKKKKK
jgi:hypothetical protein